MNCSNAIQKRFNTLAFMPQIPVKFVPVMWISGISGMCKVVPTREFALEFIILVLLLLLLFCFYLSWKWSHWKIKLLVVVSGKWGLVHISGCALKSHDTGCVWRWRDAEITEMSHNTEMVEKQWLISHAIIILLLSLLHVLLLLQTHYLHFWGQLICFIWAIGWIFCGQIHSFPEWSQKCFLSLIV